MVIAIDPGPVLSGVAVMNEKGRLDFGFTYDNGELITVLKQADTVVIEKMEPLGRIVGAETLDTAVWIGRFAQSAREEGRETYLMSRREVKRQTRAKNDSEVRRYLLARFKNDPNVLTLTGHQWQAYALGVVFLDQPAIYRQQLLIAA